MKYTFALASALLGVAAAAPTATDSSCSSTYTGGFEITVAKVTEKRSTGVLQARDSCDTDGILVMTLSDGVLKDSKGRTGYIASNNQFQFDNPPQAGSKQTSGFSICDGALALDGSQIWYQCQSGDFYNLYNKNTASYCESVKIEVMGCGSSNTATEIADGQVVGTSIVETTIVTAISDGQPQVHTTTQGIPMCQISDGQIQVHTTPCASVTTATTTAVPVSQYSDGQIQVTPAGSTTAAPASQLSDGQVQVTPTSAVLSTPPASGTTVSPVTESAPVGTGTNSVSVASTAAANTTVVSPTLSSSPSVVASSTAAVSATNAPSTSGATSYAGSFLALVLGLLAACL